MSQVITERIVEAADIERLRGDMRGPVLGPIDAGYDAARRVWNGAIDRHPAVVARCMGVADVMRALEFAREEDLVVAVRGGGHGLPGFSTCDGGIVIDLGPMKGIRVDRDARTVRAQPGVTWGQFDRETQVFGLATTGGAVSTTGISGLTLGGGLGWLMRPYGLASDNLLSADVVTADGDFVHASEVDSPDLFWGLRGGGGNFGVVTSLEYRLHPVGPTIMGGFVVYPVDAARSVLRYHRDAMATAPDELGMAAMIGSAPDGSPVSVLFACHAGTVGAGERALRGARSVAAPLVDDLNPRPYAVQQSALWDDAFPSGQGYYWTSYFVDGLTDEIIDVLVDSFPSTQAPPRYDILVEYMGGAIAALPDDATAFAHRSARCNVLVGVAWADPADAERCIEWTRSVGAAIRPFSRGGGYVNYIADEGEGQVLEAYRDRYERLAEVKARYDPGNVFRLNQNIAPKKA